MQAITSTTIREAIKAESAPIAHIARISLVKTKALLTLMINDLADFLNLGKNMTGEQVVQTVNLILEDKLIGNLKPEDFKVCFDFIKKGFYGKSFNRIDGQIIFECLYKYVSDRQDVCEQESILKGKEHVKEFNKNPIKPEYLEVMKKALEEKELKKEKVKPKYVKTERDIFIQDCFIEFQKLLKQNPVKDSEGKPTKFIMFGRDIIEDGKQGYKITQTDEIEFTQYKLKVYDLNNLPDTSTS